MTNNNLIMTPNWSLTLASFDVDECYQYKVDNEKAEKAKLRQVIIRTKQKSGKEFTTNSLLGGGFEIKRTK